MSFEGYYQLLCDNGHHFNVDAHDYSAEVTRCPTCKADTAWYHLVDCTNEPNEGYIELEENTPAEICTCACGHVHETKPATYKIPETGGHKGKFTNNPYAGYGELGDVTTPSLPLTDDGGDGDND